MSTAVRTLSEFGVVWVITVSLAFAQGNSSAKGQAKKGGAAAAAAATVSPATATSAPSASASNALYYGSWLDDASLLTPRTVWMGASTAFWKADTARQVDAPILTGAVGLTRRLQVGGSIPFYHFRDQAAGMAASGVGTVSFYGKMMILDPAATGRVGLAVAPLIEMAPGAAEAFGWALPVNVEARADRFRVYGSAGYFSRGSMFGSAALEIPTSSRSALTGTFAESHATGSHQASAGITLSFFPAPATGLFVSLSHSSDAAGLNNGGLSIGGGMSVTVQPRNTRPRP